MRRSLLVSPLALFALVAAPGCRPPALSTQLAGATWIDLSHAFDSATIYWPTAQPFRLEVVSAQRTAAGFYYAANNFAAAEHGGTHLDAPVHFAEGRWTTEAIPLERLAGAAIVIDVQDAAARDRDYLVSVADLEAWERAHGPIPAGAIVLVRTGFGRFWPDRARYLGTTLTGAGAVPALHFPGIAPEAARRLVTRGVHAVGIDTPSIDRGQSTTFDTHQVLFAANIPAFENVANLDRLPVTGSVVIALPMKIAGGSGGPLRMVALLSGR